MLFKILCPCVPLRQCLHIHIHASWQQRAYKKNESMCYVTWSINQGHKGKKLHGLDTPKDFSITIWDSLTSALKKCSTNRGETRSSSCPPFYTKWLCITIRDSLTSALKKCSTSQGETRSSFCPPFYFARFVHLGYLDQMFGRIPRPKTMHDSSP